MTLEELESKNASLIEKINELEQRVEFLSDRNYQLIDLIVDLFEELAKDRKSTETVRPHLRKLDRTFSDPLGC